MKGAYEITPFYATDERGGFIKDYNIDAFKQNGIDPVSYTHLINKIISFQTSNVIFCIYNDVIRVL